MKLTHMASRILPSKLRAILHMKYKKRKKKINYVR